MAMDRLSDTQFNKSIENVVPIHEAVKNDKELYNLSVPQKNLMMLEQFNKGTPINNISVTFYMDKELDLDTCIKALNKIVENNDSLRFTIKRDNGNSKQYVKDYVPIDIGVYNFENVSNEEVNKFCQTMAKVPFDFLESSNLYQFFLMKLKDDKVGINVTFHHSISDAWSIGIFLSQFTYNYETIKENKKEFLDTPSYLDFLKNEQQYFQSEKFKEDGNFWIEYLKKLPPIENYQFGLKKSTSKTERYKLKLEDSLDEDIKRFCDTYNVSEYSFFLAAIGLYISRTKNTDDIVLGTPILNRTSKEKKMLGAFISTLPIRLKINNQENFVNLCKDVGRNNFAIYKHQKYPYNNILDNLNDEQNIRKNIYNTMVSFQNVKVDKSHMDYDCDVLWNFQGYQQDDIIFHIIDHYGQGKYVMNIDVAEGVIEKQEIENLKKNITTIMKSVIDNPEASVSNIEFISKEEKEKLLFKFNQSDIKPDERTVIELFENAVQNFPNNIAIKIGDEGLTYSELYEKVCNVASNLKTQGIKQNDKIILVMDRSIEMVISLLGAVKAGATYVPIDPFWPDERVRFIIKDSNAKKLITQQKYYRRFNKVIECIDIETIINNRKNIDLQNATMKEDYLYYIYTSGSTGEPKGIMTKNSNVVNLFNGTKNIFDLSEKEIWAMYHTYTFDFSTWEIYGALLNGAKLIVISREESYDARKLIKVLEKERITLLNHTPANFSGLLNKIKEEKANLNVKKLLIGGESVNPRLFSDWNKLYPKTKMFEVYGPTESTIFSNYWEVNEKDIKENKEFIGKPIPGYQVYVVDNNLKLLPIGSVGEIAIAGPGICDGYLNRPDLTEKNFKKNPYGEGNIYLSGDIGYINGDGNIRCLGRNDNQVKVRGLRVELQEIENKIIEVPEVEEAIVLAIEAKNDTKRLVAAYTSKNPNIEEAIIKSMKKKLTNYMIPKLVRFEVLPLNDNGKIDRKKLTVLIANKIYENKEIILPKNKIQQDIYDVMTKYIDKSINISIDDDFQDLGIDSVDIISIFSELDNYDLDIQDYYNYGSIEKLANKILASKTENYQVKEEFKNLKVENKKVDFSFKNVLITGGTGFLGAHIIRDLLKNPETKVIYALIRKNDKNVNDRLNLLMSEYLDFQDLTTKNSNIKIYPIEGDFSLPNLGLSDENYNELVKNVNTVIHSGAKVKHYGIIDDFRRTNVEGTKNIIDFCKNSGAKLAHISTVSVGGFTSKDSNLILNENNLYIGQSFQNQVYMISKFEAECKVIEAINQDLIQGKIFRLGNIMPRLKDGKFQKNDNDNAFINGLRSIVGSKQIPYELLKEKFELSPVDLCSQSILKLMKKDEDKTIYHIYNSKFLNYIYLLGILEKNEITVEPVETQDFINEVKKLNFDGAGQIVNYLKNRMKETSVDNKETVDILLQEGFNWNTINNEYFNFILELLNVNSASKHVVIYQ